MTLRKGDRVELGMPITVEIEKFTFIRPHAIITRTLGVDPDDDLNDAKGELRKLFWLSTLLELRALKKCQLLLEDKGIDALVDYCVKKGAQNVGVKVKKAKVKGKKSKKVQ